MSYRPSQFFLVAAAVLAALPAAAQVAPGAGAVLRQLEQTPSAALPAPRPESDQDSGQARVPAGPALHVNGFSFEGNHLITTERLGDLVARFAHRDLTPAGLKQVADAVAQEYRRQGWLARVFVPPQTVTGGVVRLQVIEGRFGSMVFSDDTDLDSLRVKPARILARASEGLTAGQPISASNLERGVLLAGDLPGVSVIASEQAGEAEGETDVVLHAGNEPLVSGEIAFDNYGQAGVGSERAVGHADINSPLGFGEQFDVLGVVTPDLQYGRGALSLPLTAAGLRLAVNGAVLHYTVAVPQYDDLKPVGDSHVVGGVLEYQWLRAADHNLTVGIELQRKAFDSSMLGRINNDYRVYDAMAYATGNLYDDFLGGAVNSADISFGRGWVSMSGSPAQYWDRVNADTQGQFNVLRWRIDRTQQLPRDFSLYTALSGQLSYQNLDPSEMFYPGGPYGVGTSAVAADGGSSGQMANVELRWAGLRAFGTQTTLKLRYGAAHIRIYANDEWPAAPKANSYVLQSVGAGAQLDAPWDLHLTVAADHRVGGDAGARDPDNGLTGARRDTRVWASLQKRF